MQVAAVVSGCRAVQWTGIVVRRRRQYCPSLSSGDGFVGGEVQRSHKLRTICTVAGLRFSTGLALHAAVQRSGTHRFLRVRYHLVSRLFACWFIALILTPFTAPFPTFHLKPDSHSTESHDALPKDVKDKSASDYSAAVLSARATFQTPLARYVRTPLARRHPVQHHPAEHAVLRV